ncbi:MAG: toxin-antitoxin system YwqK family antitoxin [Acidimicrobiales bacterium]|nr:toxin-antitoxin system YwqK family antitoxin [Acidimicrobiales bacterium]
MTRLPSRGQRTWSFHKYPLILVLVLVVVVLARTARSRSDLEPIGLEEIQVATSTPLPPEPALSGVGDVDEHDGRSTEGFRGSSPSIRHETTLIAGTEYLVEWEGNTKRILYPNGALKSEGTWVAGRREGEHRSWHPNGELHSREQWTDNLREGSSVYFSEEGVRIAEGGYSDGFKAGPWRTWFKDGSLASEGAYSEGPTQREEGIWRYWDFAGRLDLRRSGYYENGRKVGEL